MGKRVCIEKILLNFKKERDGRSFMLKNKKIISFLLAFIFTFSLISFSAVVAEEDQEEQEIKYEEVLRLKQHLIDTKAPVVAVYVFIDPNHVNKPLEAAETVYKAIDTKLVQNNAVALPFEQTRKQLRTYIRENDIGDNVRESDLGFNPKRKDLQALAEEANADYVLFINSRVTASEAKLNFWTGVRKNLTILFDVVLMQNVDTDILIDETFSETGKTSGSFERAYNRATKEMLKKIDLSTVKYEKPKTNK